MDSEKGGGRKKEGKGKIRSIESNILHFTTISQSINHPKNQTKNKNKSRNIREKNKQK